MAIDTANKRFSMMNFGRPPTCPLFVPSGSVVSADKYHFLNLYAGISLASPVAGAKKVRRFIQNINRMGLR